MVSRLRQNFIFLMYIGGPRLRLAGYTASLYKRKVVIEEIVKFLDEGKHIWRSSQISEPASKRLKAKVSNGFISEILKT